MHINLRMKTNLNYWKEMRFMLWKSVMMVGMLGRQEELACLGRSQETMSREYNDT